MMNGSYWRRGSCYNICRCLERSITPRLRQVSVCSQASGYTAMVSSMSALLFMQWGFMFNCVSRHDGRRNLLEKVMFLVQTLKKKVLHNLHLNIFRVKLSFPYYDVVVHPKTWFWRCWTPFNNNRIIQNESIQKYCTKAGLTVTQRWAIYFELVGGKRGSHPSAFWRETSWGESQWDCEKWPFIFDGNEREGELTAIQTAFCADPRLRISHAVSKVY